MKLKNKRINYNGKHYNSLSQLARDYNISIPTIQTRWQKGIRNPEELIAIPNLNKKIIWEGKEYQSKKDLFRHLATPDCSASLVEQRWYEGLRTRKELTRPNQMHHKVIVNGHEYNSLAELAKAYNLPKALIKKRWYRGIREPHKLLCPNPISKQGKPITWEGKTFISYKALFQYLSTPTCSWELIKNRWKNGIRDKERLTASSQKILHPVSFQGKHFTSLGALAREFNISSDLVRSRWQRGIRNPKELIEPTIASSTAKPIDWHGKKFPSQIDLFKYLATPECNWKLIRTRWYKGIRDEKKLVAPAKFKSQSIKISYQGQNYKSLKDFARNFDISYSAVKGRWQKGIHDPEQLLNPVQESKDFLIQQKHEIIEYINEILQKKGLISPYELANKVYLPHKLLKSVGKDIIRGQNRRIGIKRSDIVEVKYTDAELSDPRLINSKLLPKYAYRMSAIDHINSKSREVVEKELKIIPQLTGSHYFWDESSQSVWSNARGTGSIFYKINGANNHIPFRIDNHKIELPKSSVLDLIAYPNIFASDLILCKDAKNIITEELNASEYANITKKAYALLPKAHHRIDNNYKIKVGWTKKELSDVIEQVKKQNNI
ncbi:hypothetical protein [Lactobacillus crispatus]|nr:hypothetical protein [Lactobacillus crispatus]NJJ54182.1 hypothetical protein [Lactobacillus crispatus]